MAELKDTFEPIYRCPQCGSRDLRVELPCVFKLDADNELIDASDPPVVWDIQDNSFMVCSAEECEHEGKATKFLAP